MSNSTASKFRIEKALGLACIQDVGRSGYAHLGITESGAADKWSMRCANALVDNDDSDAVIEITLGGFAFTTTVPISIASTGAKADLIINGEIAEQYQTINLNSGDQVEIKSPSSGARVYLAVAGGMDSPSWFNSKSVCIREGIGAALKVGEEIALLVPRLVERKRLSNDQIPQFKRHIALGLVKGFQHYLFDWQQQQRFFTTRFNVSPHADRMGYRLTTDTPIKPPIDGIRSEGVTLGAVQLPADGCPIIMLNDHQTIGGYMKIGSICRADLSQLAQALPGTEVTLYPISLELAQRRLRHQLQRVPKTLPL